MFWDNVKTKLKEQGKTISSLAKYLEISQRTIETWVYRNSDPSLVNLAKISEYLNTPIDTLVLNKPNYQELYKELSGKLSSILST